MNAPIGQNRHFAITNYWKKKYITFKWCMLDKKCGFICPLAAEINYSPLLITDKTHMT